MMQLILVVGVEGSGHHMLRDVIANFLSLENVVDKGDYYPLLEQRWDTLHERLPQRAVRSEFERIVENYERSGVTHIFEDTSFPFNQPRNPLRRPDILDLLTLTTGLLKPRILVLYRSPISTVYSALRRGFSNNICLESKMTEDNHLFIERQLRQLVRSPIRTLEFERFVETPHRFLDSLATWMGFDPVVLEGASNKLRKSTQLDQIPTKIRNYLLSFFDERRVQQWLPFYRENPLPER